MKKLLISAAFAATTLLGSAFPSAAIPIDIDTPLGLISVDVTHVVNQAIDAGDTFDLTWTFNVASLSQLGATLGFSALEADITSFTLTPQGQASINGDISASGRNAELTTTLSSAVVNYTLNVLGIYPVGSAPSSTFLTGSLSFTFADRANTPEVPLPGALLLMGTVLMGGAGLAKWRNRAGRLSA